MDLKIGDLLTLLAGFLHGYSPPHKGREKAFINIGGKLLSPSDDLFEFAVTILTEPSPGTMPMEMP